MIGVIDAELFCSSVVKELAVCTPTFSRCVSFLPPTFWENLTKKETKVNQFLTERVHNLRWDSGNLPYWYLPIVVELFHPPNVQLFSKGSQKCQVLSELFKCDVRNLEELGCPRIGQLSHESNIQCEAYPQSHTNTLHCAQLKAKTYYNWLMSCCVYL